MTTDAYGRFDGPPPARPHAVKSLIFAPAATASVTRRLRPRQRSGRRTFLFGGCLFWCVIGYLYVAGAAIAVSVWAAIVAGIWAAQVVVLVVAGPVVLVRALNR